MSVDNRRTDTRALIERVTEQGTTGSRDSLLGPVRDDWEAAVLWLQALEARRKPVSAATLDNYAREIRRLRWYCEVITPGGPAPGHWAIPDVVAYLDFLRERSGDYVCARRTARAGDADWTPFRTRAGVPSVANAQKVLHALFEFWFRAGYRRANPMAAIGSGGSHGIDESPRQAVPPDLIDQVLDWMDRRPKTTPFEKLLYVRNRFVIQLLQHTGLRANEVVMANMGDVERFDDPRDRRQYWSLLVRHGKGGKVARVLLPDLVMDELRAYRYAYGQNPEPTPGDLTAMVLSPRTRRQAGIRRGLKGTRSRRKLSLWSEVRRRASLWDVVKGAFADCAFDLDAAGRHEDAFLLKQASTHWLRHTFGRELALKGVDLRLISKAMRHGDVRTTDRTYVHTDFLDVARALTP